MAVNTQYLWSQKLALPTCRKEENKTQERLSNLPKVTRLHSVRAINITEAQTHWPQVSCIQILDTFAGGGWGPTAGRLVESQLCNQGLNSHLRSEKWTTRKFIPSVFLGYFFLFNKQRRRDFLGLKPNLQSTRAFLICKLFLKCNQFNIML